MQMTNEFIIIAKDVSTDSGDNMVSIIKMIDNFEFGVNSEIYQKLTDPDNEEIVNLPANYAIATSFRVEQKATKDIPFLVQITIFSPVGKKIGDFGQEIVLSEGNDRVRLNINSQGLPVMTDGRYKFKVEALDGSRVLARGETFVNILVSDAEAQQK